MNDVTRRFNTLRLFSLLSRVPTLRHCEAFVTNLTAAKFRALYCTARAFGSSGFIQSNINEFDLEYNITTEVVSHPEAMEHPMLNITQQGWVPTEPQTWRVDLICTHTVAAEVDVLIIVNISTGSSVTSLHFRRKKICLKESPKLAVRVDSVSPSTSADIFYAGAGCAGGVILMAAVAAAACKARARKLRRARSDEQDAHAFLPDSSCKSAASYTSYRRPTSLPVAAAEERARDLHQRITELTIQRCRVRLRSVAMEGTFGRVYRGTYADEDGREQEVLVKTVAEHASQVQVSLLLQEGCMLYGLRHERILSVLGVSIEDQTAPFLLYPWSSGCRNLKQFLLACRGAGVGGGATGATLPAPPPLTTQLVVRMALHALDGLIYLHSQHVLHKDLAARNCIVDDSLRVQIADNALSRDLFPADYHCLGDNENRPVKWLAIEALTRRAFSPASDVWAAGVLLWELTTLAHQPYAEVDPFEIAAYLRDGYRLQQPANCPDELFAVMAYCWAMSPDDRPTLTQLQMFLKDFHAQLTRFV
ncbi:Tyrosine-protein kinase Dnt [Eumeta japonica]|uniref:receptor protein-tyrosine kinase n=1 Tax=Eumeta variegata TaxID=151549 RepID=A0A4C1WAY8_EUMVA|nr:Tyrosine-protein kinase Dnt [Eumeta japonica]